MLLDTVLRLRNAGMTIIYVTHRLNEVLQIADRAIVLRDGRKVADCTRDELNRSTLVRHIIGRDLETATSNDSPAAGEVLLKVEHLTCDSELQDLSFEAKAGEVLGFFGLLGAGQACVAPALAGVRPATSTWPAPRSRARPTASSTPESASRASQYFFARRARCTFATVLSYSVAMSNERGIADEVTLTGVTQRDES
jgi:ABC-type sugar transport system ATPase subunit